MIDKSKRYVRTCVPLEKVITLQGKKIEFDSVAEMIVVRAREIPDAPFVYYYDDVITYKQVNDRANSVARYLRKKGVQKGDIVSVMVLNSPEVYYTTFGAQKLGAIAGGVNYMLKGPEIAYVLEDSRPNVAFVGSEYMEEFAKGWQLSTHKPIVLEVVTDIDHGVHIFETTLKRVLAKYPSTECLVPQKPKDSFILLYSSGTTGMPTGILLSNRNELHICKGGAHYGTTLPRGCFYDHSAHVPCQSSVCLDLSHDLSGSGHMHP